MALLTNLNGIPLYSSEREALDYAAANGLTGFHTHEYEEDGVPYIGYMGGENHNNSVTGPKTLKIELSQVLSLAGIEIPSVPNTGSFPTKGELPKELEFGEVEGIVVDPNNNEPIPGVKISNILLKRTRTDKEGKFTIEQPILPPSVVEIGLKPTTFPLTFKKSKHSITQEIPYTSTGELKSNIGIINLKPLQSNLGDEIRKLLKIPEPTVKQYALTGTTVEFTIQKQVNLSINDLKAIVIPLVLSLVATYGISEVSKLLEDSKDDPKEAFEKIKDIVSCPPKEDIDNLIERKNKLVHKINQTLKSLNTATETLATTTTILGIADPALRIISLLPLPTSVPPGVGIPVSVINKVQEVINFLSKLISRLNQASAVLFAILSLLREVLTQVLKFLGLLDLLTQFCYPETDQSDVSEDLVNLTRDQSNQLSPIVTNVNGFEMGVETEITERSLKRRRAIARNRAGVIMLKGEYSFSSVDQILIDELVFYIQQNDLKAD